MPAFVKDNPACGRLQGWRRWFNASSAKTGTPADDRIASGGRVYRPGAEFQPHFIVCPGGPFHSPGAKQIPAMTGSAPAVAGRMNGGLVLQQCQVARNLKEER